MPRRQIHWSQIAMLSRCGEQARRRYVLGENKPPGIAAVVGLATDDSVTGNLQHKIDADELLPESACADAARDAINGRWDKGVWIDSKEGRSEKDLRGEAVDKVVRLAGLHRTNIAPNIRPTHVQRAWSIRLGGVLGHACDCTCDSCIYLRETDVVGTIDIQESNTVRDTKTKAISPPKDAANRSQQLSMYALACLVIDGAIIKTVGLDFLVDLKTPVARTQWSTRGSEDMRVVINRIENAAEAFRMGRFVPADPDHWLCSPKWCGYYNTCPYVRGRIITS